MWQKRGVYAERYRITELEISQNCRKTAAKVPHFRRKSAAFNKRRKSGRKAAPLRQRTNEVQVLPDAFFADGSALFNPSTCVRQSIDARPSIH